METRAGRHDEVRPCAAKYENNRRDRFYQPPSAPAAVLNPEMICPISPVAWYTAEVLFIAREPTSPRDEERTSPSRAVFAPQASRRLTDSDMPKHNIWPRSSKSCRMVLICVVRDDGRGSDIADICSGQVAWTTCLGPDWFLRALVRCSICHAVHHAGCILAVSSKPLVREEQVLHRGAR